MSVEETKANGNTPQQPKQGMPLFGKILLGLAVLVAVFLVVVAMQPDSFRVERSTTIAAPPEQVFQHVNDFHNWDAWSPWAKLDPGMKQTYEGEPAGKDAVYTWAGNSEVGEGRMTIVESRPNELVSIKLEFQKPFAATNHTDFTFKPEADGTVVTWTMTGDNTFMFKAMHLVMNMEKILGDTFAQGLAQMKSAVEGPPKETAAKEADPA